MSLKKEDQIIKEDLKFKYKKCWKKKKERGERREPHRI